MKLFRLCLFGAIVIGVVTGCQSLSSHSVWNERMPAQRFLVGGGTEIEWSAPVSGTFYLVEAETRRFLYTKSMAADDGVHLEMSNPEEVEKLTGMPPGKCRFEAYFVPLTEMSLVPAAN